MTDIIDSVVGRRRRRQATTSHLTEKERRACEKEKVFKWKMKWVQKTRGEWEGEEEKSKWEEKQETGTVSPSDGQAVPEKDTINRSNRMKLRCVREGERNRTGGGESDKESDTRGRKRKRLSLCDENIPPDILPHFQWHQMRNSLYRKKMSVFSLFCFVAVHRLTPASSPQTKNHLWPVWRRERRGRGVGGVFERSHIQPGADRQQCSGGAVHGWFCVCALMFHILTHACKHIHSHTRRGPLWVYLFGQCWSSDRQFTMSHCRRNVLLTNGCSARTAGHREDP